MYCMHTTTRIITKKKDLVHQSRRCDSVGIQHNYSGSRPPHDPQRGVFAAQFPALRVAPLCNDQDAPSSQGTPMSTEHLRQTILRHSQSVGPHRGSAAPHRLAPSQRNYSPKTSSYASRKALFKPLGASGQRWWATSQLAATPSNGVSDERSTELTACAAATSGTTFHLRTIYDVSAQTKFLACI